MSQYARMGDLLGTLRRVRRACDECLRDRGDPGSVLRAIGPLLEAADGDVALVRSLAPGLGEVWDTVRSVYALGGAALPPVGCGDEESADAGVYTAVSGPAGVGGAVSGGNAGAREADYSPLADD